VNTNDDTWIDRQGARTLTRLMPRLSEQFAAHAGSDAWRTFERRLTTHFGRLFRLLFRLYGNRYDFLFHLETILAAAARAALARPAELQALDSAREADPSWVLSNRMIGAVCYVDLFAGNLEGIRARIPYFKELGITYLHLMPLFAAPDGESDGGYAVSDYRRVNPALGTIEQLAALAGDLRREGISLVLDFIFNHTADEHTWAQAAIAGDEERREYYYVFPDRQMPDAYEQTLREIFPDEHPGVFTYREEIGGWVWTTFHTYQWDLNYSNPAVFTAMADEMLFLANVGVEVLRLDAVAFIWKRLGTSCENLEEAHWLIQAFNAVTRIAAPALLFKSEAIVHPDDVARYISQDECQISYNPLLMALLWESLATRDVKLLRSSMQSRFRIADGCAWVNYVRCHDDIGWTFDDNDARQVGIANGDDHRRFLNTFYTGRFGGSFARGLPFQENPKTGDARISGTCASLTGLEAATGDPRETELAIRRILLIHGIILSIGGMPLLYLGDEIGMLNDYSYRDDPAKAADSRWVHRPAADAQALARRADPTTTEGQIYTRLRRLIELRRATEAFSGQETTIAAINNPQIFAYTRQHAGRRILALGNFSEREQSIDGNELRLHGLAYQFIDLIGGAHISAANMLILQPYQLMWLTPA
jgi:glycosidase